MAGLLVRLCHRLLWIDHSLLMYVDDLLSLLESFSAPLWATLLVIMLLVLRVPMSWHKASLGPRVDRLQF